MKTIQLILISLLVFISAVTWVLSAQQYDTMMDAMMIFYNPTALSLFTVIWTAGMAAMMFPAIAPMILLYDRLIKTDNSTADKITNHQNKVKEGKQGHQNLLSAQTTGRNSKKLRLTRRKRRYCPQHHFGLHIQSR